MWAEVAEGGDRRALRLYAQPHQAATAELQPSTLRIGREPLGIHAAPWPRLPMSGPTSASSSCSPASCPWAQRRRLQVSQILPGAVQCYPEPELPRGLGASYPCWAPLCPEVTQALGASPCSPSMPASSTLPWEAHPSGCLGLVLTRGGTGSMDACREPRVGWERSSRLSHPQGEPPPLPAWGSAFALRCRIFLEISTVIAFA